MEHDAHVVPYESVTDKWMLRCRCGLLEEYAQQDDAEDARDEHLLVAQP